MDIGVSEPAAAAVDRDGFADFYRTWFPSVARAAALIVRDVEGGQEIAQEAFMRLWQGRDRIESNDHARNFVFRVALNGARSHLRRTRRLRLFLERRASEPSESGSVQATDRVVVFEALRALSVRQRECLVLVDYLGYDAASVGRLLGIQPVTVRVQLMRGRERLRRELGEEPRPNGIP
jgi:RNA polymerase sigma factor (sigma-70 family)